MEINSRLQFLIAKYLDKTQSEAENAELLGYMDDPAYLEKIGDLLEAAYENEPGREDMDEIRQQHLLQNVFLQENKERRTPRVLSLWARVAVAASVLLVSGLGFYFYQHREAPVPSTSATADIAPGKQGATLTLASGKKIRLADASKGELAKEAGVSITKTADGKLVYQLEENNDADGKINTLSTSNGETYQVRLPDGSAVWLNSASSLSYNTSLNDHGRRMVDLTGEAYFEIAKDKAHPFIVHTDKQDVEVLGTHFNINAYNDEVTSATTLMEGSVKIKSGANKQIIKPGQQAINTGSDIKVAEVNTESVTDWKDGDFNLEDVKFKIAMRKIARWYDVDFIYDSSVPEQLELGGWISRNKPLSQVLKFIETSGKIHFRVKDKKIFVTK